MPQIYTPPIPFTITGTDTDAVSDGNKYTSYNTTDTDVTINFTGTPRISTIYVLADNYDSVSFTGFTGANPHGFGTDITGGITYDSRRGAISTVAEEGLSRCTLRFTRTSGRSSINIYQILALRHLLPLNNSDTRSITSYEVRRGIRNAFVQEDLYGNRSLQTGHLRDARKTINYTIWQRGDNLTAARNELSELYNVQRQYPNITIWDIDEPGSQDYESVFQAFWVPDSFSESIEGTQVVNHSFTIEQQ